MINKVKKTTKQQGKRKHARKAKGESVFTAIRFS